ncbi:MAG TPA: class I SAM-dependent methyltransferase [Halalkalibaculum sp.]|nr:class I SAM-dependent methyltransferase [Halalkalibaculum sp.]
MDIISSEIEKYAERATGRESELVQELVEVSKENLEYVDMISGRVVGRLLAMLIKISGAKRVLEIGTFSGYSALSMAEALPEDGELITCEYNERYEKLARSFFSKSKHGHKITLKMGLALDTIEELDGSFDFVYLDADKVNYPGYYEKLLPMLKDNGLIVIDNVLWSGAVLKPDDEKAKAIDELNEMIRKDERVEQVMLTVRDGLTLARKL